MARYPWVLISAFAVCAPIAQPNESLVAVAADGTVVARIDGGPASAPVGATLDALLRRPEAHIRLTHNHPTGTSLSAADLEQLTKPGVDAIEAIGNDGSRYEARRGIRFDMVFFELHQYRPADEEVARQLLRHARGEADRAAFDAHHSHVTALALQKANIIVYHASLSADRSSSYESRRSILGQAAEAGAARVRDRRPTRGATRGVAIPEVSGIPR